MCSHRAAFGIQQKRFQFGVGYHPGFETRGANFHNPRLGPGSYDKVEKRKVELGYGWKNCLELKEFSENLGYHGEHVLKERRWQRSMNGPGSQDVPEMDSKGISFEKASRFRKDKRFGVPGPGIYGKEHIPSKRLEEKSKAKGFYFTDIPTFEWDMRPRGTSLYRSYHLPPNLYTTKQGFVDLILNHVCSKRGPYDLFTGPRDETTLYGHSSAPLDKGVDQLFNFPDGIDILNHPKNYFKGKMSRIGRETFPPLRHMMTDLSLCRKNPRDPAPNHYDVVKHWRRPKQSIWPFDSSVLYARPVMKNALQPGPGRYFLTPPKQPDIIGDGMKSGFISKTQRKLYTFEKYGWFD